MKATFQSSGDLIADRRFAYGQDCLADGDFQAAADLFEQALERAPDFAPGWFELGKARLNMTAAGAADAFREALRLEPEDRLGAGLYLAKLEASPGCDAMSIAYIRDLFEAYADRFDSHLTDALSYTAPEQLRLAIDSLSNGRLLQKKFGTIVDLGCGTGLSGAAFADISNRMIGCDLSPAMITAARKKSLYMQLEVADMVTFLNRQTGSADLVLAADVFVYMGNLEPVFRAASVRLSHDGIFAFTVQAATGDGFLLGEDMRYAHSAGYLKQMAALTGFRVLRLAPVSTRMDAGKPVPGFLVVLEMDEIVSKPA